MKDKVCPECQRIMSYDPYFKSYICRQCGRREEVLFESLPIKRKKKCYKVVQASVYK